MHSNQIFTRHRAAAVALAVIALSGVAFAEDGDSHGRHESQNAAVLASNQYKQTNLVSNLPGNAPITDPNLVNPWGLSRSSGSPWWVADNGTGLSTLYDGLGTIESLVVTIPPSNPNASSSGTPTGTMFNGTTDFEVAPQKPAVFLFVGEDGVISGWNPGANPTIAIKVVNQKEHSVFKGATIATVNTRRRGTHNYIYVADFRQGKIEVFDTKFKRVFDLEHEFEEERLPRGYAPFNVQNIGGNLYVAYAKQDGEKHDEVDGSGLGFVRVYSPSGEFLHRLDHGWFLNAPWGLVQAPSDFGPYSHDILVGNFGSGLIAAFDPVTGEFKDVLRDATSKPIAIDGLWGLSFGNGGNAGPATSLYFSAGTDHESGGLFGNLTALQNPQGNDQ